MDLMDLQLSYLCGFVAGLGSPPKQIAQLPVTKLKGRALVQHVNLCCGSMEGNVEQGTVLYIGGDVGRRTCLGLSLLTATLLVGTECHAAKSGPKIEFHEVEGSGGVKALDIRVGTGPTPQIGDEVVIHYYGRLAAKQGWRFDSTYDHKDETGTPVPFIFIVGSGAVISGLDAAVRTMKMGGVRRVIIPPSQGYQNTSQEPVPPNFFDRQRLFTTIFNPTRLSNGESSTLGTLIFDIELLGIHSS